MQLDFESMGHKENISWGLGKNSSKIPPLWPGPQGTPQRRDFLAALQHAGTVVTPKNCPISQKRSSLSGNAGPFKNTFILLFLFLHETGIYLRRKELQSVHSTIVGLASWVPTSMRSRVQ